MYQFLLAAASTLLNMEAEKKAGEAEQAAGIEDYSDAALSGHFREKGVSEKRDRILSKIRSRAAASGVDMSGSPLEVLAHSAGQAERDLFIARHITDRNLDNARSRMTGGAAAKGDAALEGVLGLATAGVKAKKRSVGGYVPSDGVAEEDWMKEYGND